MFLAIGSHMVAVKGPIVHSLIIIILAASHPHPHPQTLSVIPKFTSKHLPLAKKMDSSRIESDYKIDSNHHHHHSPEPISLNPRQPKLKITTTTLDQNMNVDLSQTTTTRTSIKSEGLLRMKSTSPIKTQQSIGDDHHQPRSKLDDQLNFEIKSFEQIMREKRKKLEQDSNQQDLNNNNNQSFQRKTNQPSIVALSNGNLSIPPPPPPPPLHNPPPSSSLNDEDLDKHLAELDELIGSWNLQNRTKGYFFRPCNWEKNLIKILENKKAWNQQTGGGGGGFINLLIHP